MSGTVILTRPARGRIDVNLSGWAWMVPALVGSWIGVRLRPAFALTRGASGPVC